MKTKSVRPAELAAAHGSASHVNRRSLIRLVRRIRHSLKKRQSKIIEQKEWEGAKGADWENETDTVARIADAAKCDWLLDTRTGEARFFEGM
jgi:hypothetical protein